MQEQHQQKYYDIIYFILYLEYTIIFYLNKKLLQIKNNYYK